MTVLAGEMRSEHPELEADLDLLQQQLDRCDVILGELVASARHDTGRRRAALGDLVDELLAQWRIARPEVRLAVDRAPGVAELVVEYDQSLVHALLNLLHNSADASPDDVGLKAGADGGAALLVVEDRGAGIPEDIADALGSRFVSRKDGGLGLGVLLSSASIERLGGEVTLHDREGGGTRWEIRLPVTM